MSSLLEQYIQQYRGKSVRSEYDRVISPLLDQMPTEKHVDIYVYIVRLVDCMRDLLQHHTLTRSKSDLLFYVRLREYANCIEHEPKAQIEEDSDERNSMLYEREERNMACREAFYAMYSENTGCPTTEALRYLHVSNLCKQALEVIDFTMADTVEETLEEMGLSSELLYMDGEEKQDLAYAAAYYRRIAYTELFEISSLFAPYAYDYVPTKISEFYQENVCLWVETISIPDTYLMDPSAKLVDDALVSLDTMPSLLFHSSPKRMRDED